MRDHASGGSDPRISLTPVVRGGLTDRVIDQLRQRITDGMWSVDERLPVEAALAQDLGVGRSTIREAVRVLAHSGMLEVRQGDGTFVRSRREIDAALRRRVLRANLLDSFEVRRGLEIEAARLAAQHGSAAEIATLRRLATTRQELYDTDAYRRADLALREHVVEMTGNPLFGDLYRGFVEPLRSAVRAIVDDAELTRDDPGMPETPELVEAIARKDVPAAVAAAERHMENVIRLLTLVLQAVVVER